jgi:hypothetical protein
LLGKIFHYYSNGLQLAAVNIPNLADDMAKRALFSKNLSKSLNSMAQTISAVNKLHIYLLDVRW